MNKNFCNGFECGIIWERVSEGKEIINMVVHDENIKQIGLICETFGVKAKIKPITNSPYNDGYGWSLLTVESVIKNITYL